MRFLLALLLLLLPTLARAAPLIDHLDLASPALARRAPFQEGDDRIVEIQQHLVEATARIGARAHGGPSMITANEIGFFLLDDGDQIVGAAIARRTGHGVRVQIRRATITRQDTVRALTGRRRAQTLSFGHRPMLDCGLSRRPGNCRPIIVKTIRRTAVLEEQSISTRFELANQRGRIRLVLCVDADPAPPEDVLAAIDVDVDLELVSSRLAGLPFVRDAATGAPVSMRCE